MGGVVGGVALIAIAVIGAFYLRWRRPQAPSAAFVIDGPSRPYYEPRKPLSDDRTPPSSSTHETPVSPMRVYVCIFCPSFSFVPVQLFCTTRTRTTQPLFQGTKGLSMREMPLPDSLSCSTTALEQPWPTHGPRCRKAITVSLTSDFLRILHSTHCRTCAFQSFFIIIFFFRIPLPSASGSLPHVGLLRTTIYTTGEREEHGP